ncbi:uncharacterized protein LOC117186211 [Drosophila miranda]|uniref:uncharacterized protein LOC117186211 n=1 Tax=Drosophila miranda TaxID=7229 RepID=UPI00143F4764|nr:uncharacterized protein LOC117186211 [Drosophila miranda]
MSHNKRNLVHRKSIRAQRQLIKQNSKLNGLNVNVARTRPRFPTPEVAKDGSTNPASSAVVVAPSQHQSTPQQPPQQPQGGRTTFTPPSTPQPTPRARAWAWGWAWAWEGACIWGTMAAARCWAPSSCRPSKRWTAPHRITL